MASEKLTEEFKIRLASVLKDLKENGQKDSEAMWLMGSLAAHIINAAGEKNWPGLKAALTSEGYDSLLTQFEQQGHEFLKQGKKKSAYAVQALAVSLIASKMQDPVIATGNALLDDFIGRTLHIYKSTADQQTKLN